MRFFELICPNCRHQFVWLEHSHYSGYIYRRKGHNEELESTICPKCNIKIAVLKDSSSGLDITDESIEIADIMRGI